MIAICILSLADHFAVADKRRGARKPALKSQKITKLLKSGSKAAKIKREKSHSKALPAPGNHPIIHLNPIPESKNIMNTKSLILGVGAAGALLTSSAFAQSAVSDPVGYRTDDLAAGFNLISPNLSQPVAASGSVASVTGTTVTSDGTIALTAGVDYTVQFSGGLSTEVVSSTGTTLETADAVPTVVGETFTVRATPTLSLLFGADNSAGLIAGNGGPAGADVVWVPTATGFDQFYFNGTAGAGIFGVGVGWRGLTTANVDQSDAPVFFTDGIFLQRFGSSTDGIVFVGHVITEDSEVAVASGFNFVGRVLPVEVTLGNSNLESDLTQGAGSADGADVVWIPNADGGFDQFYFNGTAGAGIFGIGVGWRGLATGDVDQSAQEITSGFIIQNMGDAKMVTLAIPDGLDI